MKRQEFNPMQFLVLAEKNGRECAALCLDETLAVIACDNFLRTKPQHILVSQTALIRYWFKGFDQATEEMKKDQNP